MARRTCIRKQPKPLALAATWNRFKFNEQRNTELSVALQKAQFEDHYLCTSQGELLNKIYKSFDDYVNAPDKQNKLAVSNILQANWRHLPQELKKKGKAYRIWIFKDAYAKRAYLQLVKTGSMNVRVAEFLSFTEANPIKDTVFKKYWTVFNGSITPDGNLVLIQKQEYKKGFSVTDYMKYLLTQGILVEEDDMSDDEDYDPIELDTVGMMNNEQELFVFDDVLKISKSDILAIRVTVPKKEKPEGLLIPITGAKFVPVKTLQEAKPLLEQYNPKFSSTSV